PGKDSAVRIEFQQGREVLQLPPGEIHRLGGVGMSGDGRETVEVLLEFVVVGEEGNPLGRGKWGNLRGVYRVGVLARELIPQIGPVSVKCTGEIRKFQSRDRVGVPRHRRSW